MTSPAQQPRDIETMLDQCWAGVVDGGPSLTQHWINVSCLLGGQFLILARSISSCIIPTSQNFFYFMGRSIYQI